MSIDFSTFDLGLARPRLREDLRFTLHESGRQSWYLIEDELNSKYYRIGRAEYVFLSYIDGETTVQSAIAKTAAELGASAFSEAAAAALCKWLIDTDLATKQRLDGDQMAESRRRRHYLKRLQWLNPIMWKVPIGNPNKHLAWLASKTGWLIGWPALAVWCATCLFALIMSCWRPDQWVTTSPIYARDNWLALVLTWLLLRVIHESAHGVVCRHFGGTVREWGVLMLMFVPLPYVDVTSAWRFPEKSQRILTSAAGVLAELFIAAVAAIIWVQSDSPFVRQHALNVVFAASITTLFFNANPLMRFDGYHILADWLDTPNLWTHGRQYVRSIGRRVFLDLPTSDPPWSKKRVTITKVYGVASLCWTIVVLTSLSLAAFSLLDGVGLVLAMIAATLWIGMPAFRLGRFLVYGSETELPNRRRFVVAVATTIVAVLGLGVFLPAPFVVRAPIVIEHDPLLIIRNPTAGFVSEILVQRGQQVSAGDVICRLQNMQLNTQLTDTRVRLEESRLRLRGYSTELQPGAVQYEMEATVDLEQRLAELERMADDLTIRAAVDGQILTLDIHDQLDAYLEPGTEIASIGGLDGKCAIALVPQDDVQSLTGSVGALAKLRIWGEYGGAFEGQLRKTNPRAQTELPHFSLAAPYGGPLPVIAVEPVGFTDDQQQQEWRLVEPHFRVEIQLQAEDANRTKSGQTGVMHVRTREGSIGAWILNRLTRILRTKVERTHGL